MTVLVAAASKHGATEEIAARIGADLAGLGLDVGIARVHEGDSRDWHAIDQWAATIAGELRLGEGPIG
jgi:menaquinone-dependent protoporphyrinogen IX oxidase